MKYIFIALMLALLAIISGAARSTGQVLIRGVDQMQRTSTCTLPFERVDGSPLLISEIESVELYFLPDLMNPDPMPHYVDTSLLCSGDYDLDQFTNGQWYLYWKTTDRDKLTSTRSPTVPFVLRDPNAEPNAPSNPTL